MSGMYKIRVFSVMILLIGLTLTFIVSYSVYQDNEKIDLQDFETNCRSFESEIRIHLRTNSQILYSSASFISSSDTITRSEWKEFQTLNKSLTEAVGIQGIGFSKIIRRRELNAFEEKVSENEFPGYEVRPEGERELYSPVLYLEPCSEKNRMVLGYDGFSEPIRQRAMVMARDSDMAVISDKIFLVQDSISKRQPGALMFVPVFKVGTSLRTPEERANACVGWVFCPFRMNDFIRAMADQWNFEMYRVQVFDNSDLSDDSLLFDSDSEFNLQRKSGAMASFSLPMNFNGKTWTLFFSSFNHDLKSVWSRVYLTLLMGLTISLLLFVLAVSLVSARARTRRIQELNDELKKVNESKDRFISVLAHDLKNPFSTLLGFSEIMVQDMNELSYKQIEHYANQIYSAARITHQLLDELLMWARVQSDQLPFNPERVNICQLCTNLVKEFELAAGKKNINVCLNKEDERFVFADELMVKTILRNLITNAIKFTNVGGSIRICGNCNGDEVVVTVEDSGIGMSEQQVSKLFDISSKTSKEGTAGEKGTGLGLLLCKDMVEKNKGRIWVESELGKGSKFMFTLPLVK